MNHGFALASSLPTIPQTAFELTLMTIVAIFIAWRII